METRSSLTTEFIRVPIAASEDGFAIDPTQDTVRLAIVATGTTPTTLDWHLGSWESDSSSTPVEHFARLLVGPAAAPPIVLTAGLYDVFVKISDDPEIVVRDTGALAII